MRQERMRLREYESRPPASALEADLPTFGAIVGGATAVLGAHVVLPLVWMLAITLLVKLGILTDRSSKQPSPEKNVIHARFVKLGEILDPRHLPNRKVPLLTTAPPQETAVSKAPQEHPETPDAGPNPPKATEDPLRRLGDRAQVFAEIAEKREQEGDPNGIEEGTAEKAEAGDLYAARLYAFFRNGWTIPTLISEDERRGLVTEVDVQIQDNLRIGDFRVRRSSGNPLFDQSVLDRLEQIRSSDTALPPPPPEVAQDYLGRTIGLNFRGKDG